MSLAHVQRGMLRHVFLVLDMSTAMEAADLKPTRAVAVLLAAKEFVREYFDQNPISALGVIVCRNAVATKVSDLSANPKRQLDALDRAARGDAPPPVARPAAAGAPAGDAVALAGSMTLQTALEVAGQALSLVPTYGSKEVIVIHGAHSFADPGNILGTLGELVKANVRVSFVSLPGEVYIAAKIARETGGTCAVPVTRDDLHAALLAHCPPPPKRAVDVAAARVHMVRMGFPTLVSDAPGPCACHAKLKPRGYICPRCASRLCELPTTCPVCSLQLVSAPALARSYHHLFPVPPYVEVPSVTAPGFLSAALASAYSGGASAAAAAASAGASATDGDDAMRGDGSGEDAAAAAGAIYDVSRLCTACIAPLAPDAPRFVCPECVCAFCADCDAVIHDTLHNCPGCV